MSVDLEMSKTFVRIKKKVVKNKRDNLKLRKSKDYESTDNDSSVQLNVQKK